jgi:hypothetical protein
MKWTLCTMLALVAGVSAIGSARGADEPASASPEPVDSSINSGLAFLAKQQNAEGAFDAGGGPRIATTGLALMSFLATGNTPDDGKYGQAVRRALDFLVRTAPADDGYFGKLDGSQMYGQGIVTLALAEAYGVAPDEQSRAAIRVILNRAVAQILKAQNVPKEPINAGGWRYEPGSADSDLSLSGWNILALRAAGNVGIDVPKDHIDRARSYVLQCYNKLQSGFAYQPRQDATIGMTSVAILNLSLLDAGNRDEVLRGVQFILDRPVTAETRFPYYTMYYVAQAGFQVGDPAWSAIWRATRERLLKDQSPDGGWPQSRTGEEPGRTYATSMAILTLSVPRGLLPTYQR